MSKYLVVGASGNVGSELVRLLQKQGAQVRATTGKRDGVLSSAGAEKVYVDLATGEGIREAFEGVERAFFLSPGGYADQYKVLAPLIGEAKRRQLKKVVLMTALGANATDTAPLRRAEIELEQSGVPYNIIRPNWFLQNFNTIWVEGIRAQGKIALPTGDAKASFIDTRDISAVAAKLLASDELNNRAFDLTGPEAISHVDIANAIGAAAGKKITYEDVAPEVLKKGLVKAGLPVDYVDFLILIFGFFKQGYNATVNDNVKAILGRAPMGISTYVGDYKQAWV